MGWAVRHMNADFLTVWSLGAGKKGIRREILVAAVEEGFGLRRKKAGRRPRARCVIDTQNRDIKGFDQIGRSEKVLSKQRSNSPVFDARRTQTRTPQLGDEIEVEVKPAGFGRNRIAVCQAIVDAAHRRAEKQ